MHRSVVKVMILVKITILNGYFNLAKTHNAIGSQNLYSKAFMCSLGIQHAYFMSNLNDVTIKCLSSLGGSEVA